MLYKFLLTLNLKTIWILTGAPQIRNNLTAHSVGIQAAKKIIRSFRVNFVSQMTMKVALKNQRVLNVIASLVVWYGL
jgi:ribosomal protein L5